MLKNVKTHGFTSALYIFFLFAITQLSLSPLMASPGANQELIKVNGAGASFPFPIYSKWFSEYQKTNKQVQFNYQAIGSGGGIRQLLKQTVDFGASDAPMKKSEVVKAPWPVVHVPTVLGAVAITYNLEGINELKLDSQIIANIFLGKCTKWNDPKIVKLNPNLTLPNKDILPVRRADGSGTTAVFTDFLSNISKDWKENVGTGKSVRWPTGVGAKGSDGVTGVVKQTPGAISYVEVAYAYTNKLATAKVKNLNGQFVGPTIEGVSSAAKGISDFTSSIVNSANKGAYPISAFTYILLPKPQVKSKQLSEVIKFLGWALNDGQVFAKDLHYAPLPKSVAQKAINSFKK